MAQSHCVAKRLGNDAQERLSFRCVRRELLKEIRVTAFARLLIIVTLAVAGTQAWAQPIPPCPAGNTAVVPAYGEMGGPPVVQTWHDIDIEDREACLGGMRGRMALVVALAVRFDGAKSLEDVATRIGAISVTEGLPYWSVTDRQWRPLISESFAIDDPISRRRRPDFMAQEILSGRRLYFAQNDTRSTGLNVYSLSATSVAPDRLVVEIVNLTPIRFALVTLFDPQALRSVHFADRLETDVWGYYGISAVRAGAVDGQEKSFVNRAGAFYRFLAGISPEREPPLAP